MTDTPVDPSDLVDPSDAMTMGYKLVEMAERIILASKFKPGCRASWSFDMDGQRFDVVVVASEAEVSDG